MPNGFEEALRGRLRDHEAREIVRTLQQGYGRPIISCETDGWRVVAVGARTFYRKGWAFFADFLLHYLRGAIWKEAAERASKTGLSHPVLGWFERLRKELNERGSGASSKIAVPETGYAAAMLHLAYSLYLIEHHDQVSPVLIKRLAIPDQFRPAVYEAIVTSVFALAGFRIQSAELSATDASEPELYATSNSGRRYAVEAKRRHKWEALCDVADEFFEAELKSWIRNRVYAANSKKLLNPIYWLELSIPAPIDEAGWRLIHRWIREAIDGLEADLKERGIHSEPAYVFVTNNPHLADDDCAASPLFAVLEPFLMDDFRTGRVVELEEGFAMKDRHRDVTWVFDCLSEVQRVPVTFDGSVPGLVAPDGIPTTLRIGARIEVSGADGQPTAGILDDISTAGDHAYVVVRNVAGEEVITRVALTENEQRAALAYGDAAFGKPQKKQRAIKSVFEWYDWFLGVFASYDRKALLVQIGKHPQIRDYERLQLADLRIRVARELAKATHRLPGTTDPNAGR